MRGREGADEPGKTQLVAPRGREGLLSWLEQTRLESPLALPQPPLGLRARCHAPRRAAESSLFLLPSTFPPFPPPPSLLMQLRLATNRPPAPECWDYRAYHRSRISLMWHHYYICLSPLVCGCTCGTLQSSRDGQMTPFRSRFSPSSMWKELEARTREWQAW